MKKGITIALSLFLLASCNDAEEKSTEAKVDKDASKKGHWSESDWDKANAAVKEVEDELEVLGENKQPYIDCYLEKMENNYKSFADADADMAGAKKLAEECAKEVLGM